MSIRSTETTPQTLRATRPAAPGPAAGRVAVGGQPTVEELRRQLAEAPPEVVVANHCYGLFELAAVYLSQSPPLLDEARLAIDALGYVVDGLGERLGDASRRSRTAWPSSSWRSSSSARPSRPARTPATARAARNDHSIRRSHR